MPDSVLQAQFGHLSPAMKAVYSHIRRKALNDAAQGLELDVRPTETPSPEPVGGARQISGPER